MPYSDSSSGSSLPHQQSWFNGGPRRLRGLLIVASALIAGMFLGRFLTQSEMQHTVLRLEAELASREAEIGILHHEALQPPPEQLEIERLNEQHQQLLARFDELERNFAVRQQLIKREIDNAIDDRQACLAELREFQQLKQSLPADDVLRFAEQMFEVRTEILESLTDGRARTAETEPTVPFPVIHEPNLTVETAKELAQSENGLSARPPMLPQVRTGEPTGVFFGPPQRRTGYTFLTPHGTSRIAAAKSSRVLFSEGADDREGPVLR